MSTVTIQLVLADAEVRFYKEEGYLILPGLLGSDVVARLRNEVLEVLDAGGVPRDSLRHATGPADKLRQFSDYLAGSALDELINGGSTLALASQLIGGRAIRYAPFTAVKAGGGGGTLHYHQDNNYTRHEPALGSINIWVALVDMTPDNGCLRIVPRSHRADIDSRMSDDRDGHRQVDVDPLTALPIRMHAGSAVAFSRWTVHGSGPNTTGEPRIAYALQYHREDVRYFDAEVGEWRLLIDTPRFQTAPVASLARD